MQDKPFDYLVFIGRFQPFHLGHQKVIHQALEQAKQVIVLIGSANSPRTTKNPFTVLERQAMIQGSVQTTDLQRLHCLALDDAPYNDDKWLMNTMQAIESISDRQDRIGIIGHDKDNSSYYLTCFPQYQKFWVDNFQNLSATPIRQAYFRGGQHWQDAKQQLPPSSQRVLTEFLTSPHFSRLQKEFRHIEDYQKSWQNAPYPPSFITADALVVQAGHILLIKRGGDYGHGLYALPGGFVDQNEDFLAAAVRELREETGLNLQPIQTQQFLKASRLFDAPGRSQRARTVTVVHHFELPACQELPSLQAGDDAKQALWLPLSRLDASNMFEDHYGLICKMLGI